MKNKLSFYFLFSLIACQAYSQINYEKGYFISNDGSRSECLIRNTDWKNNPEYFQYKASENDPALKLTLFDVKEFGIYDYSKYIRQTVDIDRSGTIVNDLSASRNPVWSREQVFLKVLVEGHASLYLYEGRNLRRFFYSVNNSPVQQLVYKKYILDGSRIGVNNYFIQQLQSDVGLPDYPQMISKNIGYTQHDLAEYFNKYNGTSPGSVGHPVKTPGLFNMKFKMGLDYSSLSIRNNINDYWDNDFSNKLSTRIEIETEFILPFNKNKWAIFFSPGLNYYLTSKQMPVETVTVNYKTMEIPVGLRYYMYAGKKSRIFVNSLYGFGFPLYNSGIKGKRDNLYIKRSGNLAFGCGMGYKRLNAEFRYNLSRDILSYYVNWYSYYNKLSLVIGYRLF